MTIFFRFPFDKRKTFLDDPVTFILKELEKIIKSQDMDKRILTLIYMTFYNGEMTKTEVEAIMDHNIKDGTDKKELTRECIKQLLQESLAQRNEIWTSLGNVRIMEDKYFQQEWQRTNGRHKKPNE